MQDIILFNDPEAAQQKPVTGWVSRHGYFFGDDERAARYNGSTHRLCTSCESPCSKAYTMCRDCRRTKNIERYNALPYKKWNGKDMLCCHGGDDFFSSVEEIESYCNYHGLEVKDLRLVICEPNFLGQLEVEYWDELLPDDYDPENIDAGLKEKIDSLNSYIRGMPPVSWSEGNYRTSIELITTF